MYPADVLFTEQIEDRWDDDIRPPSPSPGVIELIGYTALDDLPPDSPLEIDGVHQFYNLTRKQEKEMLVCCRNLDEDGMARIAGFNSSHDFLQYYDRFFDYLADWAPQACDIYQDAYEQVWHPDLLDPESDPYIGSIIS